MVEVAAKQMLCKTEEESKNSHYLPLISSLVQTLFSDSLVRSMDVNSTLLQVSVVCRLAKINIKP